MSALKVPAIFTAVDKFSKPLEKMVASTKKFGVQAERSIARVERRFRKLNHISGKLSRGFFVGGLAIAAPLVLAAKHAVEFEDKMADVAKTTGLQGKALKELGEGILDIAIGTRSSINELQDIAVVGGQMGVAGKEMEAFVASADKFNVALGSDFAGGTSEAVTSVSKLQSLFKQTRDLEISDSITKAGSVINALSGAGKASASNINEFLLRVGALPDALKPSIQSAAALGTVLEESGITAEIGGRAYGILMTTAGKNLSQFATQMSLTQSEASDLLANDPAQFASKFADSFKGLKAEELARKLKKLKIGSDGVIKVIGALGSNTKRLTELQSFSNDEFRKGTSLLDEFNTKNSTMAAKLKISQNNFKAISIIIGTELIPIMSELLKEFLPFVKAFSKWIKDNPKTLKRIVKTAVVLGTLMFALAGLAKVTAIASFAMANFGIIMAIATSPVTLAVAAILLLIGVTAIIVDKYEEWGAAATLLLGPIGTLISLGQEFRRSWGTISDMFTSGDIKGGILEIGKVIISALLNPLQQFFDLLAKVPGMYAIGTVNSSLIQKVKDAAGVETPAINPKAEEQNALINKTENNNNTNATLTVLAPKGTTKIESDDDFFPIISGALSGQFN
jgi:TP901 family phage tail tape measure protein